MHKIKVLVTVHDEIGSDGFLFSDEPFELMVDAADEESLDPNPKDVIKTWLTEFCDYIGELEPGDDEINSTYKYHRYHIGDGVIVVTDDRDHLAVLVLSW